MIKQIAYATGVIAFVAATAIPAMRGMKELSGYNAINIEACRTAPIRQMDFDLDGKPDNIHRLDDKLYACFGNQTLFDYNAEIMGSSLAPRPILTSTRNTLDDLAR